MKIFYFHDFSWFFKFQICNGNWSWERRCTNFQEICYSKVQFFSDTQKCKFWILGALHHICSWKAQMKTKTFFTWIFSCKYEASTIEIYAKWFHGSFKITKKKTLHRLWLAIALTKIFHCCVFFIHICSGGCSQQD